MDIVSSFEAYGELLNTTINQEQYDSIIQNSCHKECGSCSGLYTANTMASILEVMGITLPNSSSNPSMSSEKYEECNKAGETMEYLLENNIKPLDIITKESFENAIKLTYLLGGSTNAVIHLLAIAYNANIKLTLDDFSKFKKTPVITNMKPHGTNVMYDLYETGGMVSLLKYFIDKNYINGDLKTITGKTISENIDDKLNQHDNNQNDNAKTLIKHIKDTSHINILYGNLAPDGCVAKDYNNDRIPFYGSIRVFESEEDFIKKLEYGKVSNKEALLIRNQGESIGCPEMLSATSALVGYFGEDNVPPLLTDGRFSGGSRGMLIAHLPDANIKDNITRYIQNDDKIYINLRHEEIMIILTHKELEARKKNIDQDYYDSTMKPHQHYVSKYSKLASNIKYGFAT